MLTSRVPFQQLRNDFVRPELNRDPRSQPPKRPRHRIERPPAKRHLLAAGSFVVACAAVAISVGLATSGAAIGATASAPSPSISDAQPEPILRSTIVTSDGDSAGPVTGGTIVTVTGADMSDVASVSFGGNAGQVVAAMNDMVILTTPPSTNFTTGTVAVELFDILGKAVEGAAFASSTTDGSETVGSAAAPAAAAAPAPAHAPAPAVASVTGNAAATRGTSINSSTASVIITPLTFSYVPDPNITAQTNYVLAHWRNYNSAAYGVIPGNDCVNFVSQSLIARGWTKDPEWFFNPATFEYSAAWVSSTAFAAYLTAHPERATALTDTQRALVKVGDVVQFDWDLSGDRDHTGIVTRVAKTGAGVQIYYASHTTDADFKSVDESLASAGGTVSYWSIS